jgi:hypothetical protein
MLRRYFILIFLINTACSKSKPTFQLLDSEDTGIQFSNMIIENDTINILNLDDVYNGSGVGVADFNHDGLQDLFFSANQSSNKLYLNLGEFKFQDITEKAGVPGEGKWSSGVALVDINQDGWMDIYVAATSTNNSLPEIRENELYVHQGLQDGIPVFKEMAKEYGINDNGHSENAAFFDYDNDGDLDLYVLTNRIDKYPNQFKEKLVNGENPNTDRLYRNDWNDSLGHVYYTNVSKEAGILIEGFGLGINVTDINNDGWKDVYICNDYVTNDILYLNNQNGTFTDHSDEYFKHTSHSSMGNDVADINNDGLMDIMTVDMVPRNNDRKKMFTPPISSQFFKNSDSYHFTYQYGRNALQLNNGPGQAFSDISLLADVAETDWSWTPSLADFDNDGYRDILITNGFPKDVTDKDFMSYRAEIDNLMSRASILEKIPAVKISNYAFKNNGNLEFEDVTDKWGLNVPSFSNGAVYADLDNDGDLDYVVNNINEVAFVYKNNSREMDPEKSNFLRFNFKGSEKNRDGLGAKVIAKYMNGQFFTYEHSPYRGYKSSVELFGHVGLGADSVLQDVKVIWPNGAMQHFDKLSANTVITFDIANAKEHYEPEILSDLALFQAFEIPYKHSEIEYLDENFQNLMPFRLSQTGPGMSVGDVNGDGLEDVFIGGPSFRNGTFLIQNLLGGFAEQKILPAIDSVSKLQEDIGTLLFDADGDGDKDLYIVSGGNEDLRISGQFADRFYENKGKGIFVENKSAIPLVENAGSCVRAGDFDKDGDLDLFVAGRNIPHQFPKKADSYLLENISDKGSPKFKKMAASKSAFLKETGLICDALWTDVDKDGDPDLLVVGDFMPPTFYVNNKGSFSKLENTGLEDYKGLWSSIQGADFDLDGDIDYVIGNMGRNTLFKGDKEYPVNIYSGDFDGNKVYDIIPFVYFRNGKNQKVQVPYSSREDLNKQLNSTRQRFTTFQEYTLAKPENVLLETERNASQLDEMNWMQSSYVENLGNGKFKLTALPIRAQFSSVRGMIVEDFNDDGYPDVLISSNNFTNELQVGRYDASNGLLLLNDKKGSFIENWRNGFIVPGDAKSLVSISDANGNMMVLAAQNQGKLLGFKTSLKTVRRPEGKFVLKYQIDNKKTQREYYWGSSYLSQSGEYVHIPSNAKGVVWY